MIKPRNTLGMLVVGGGLWVAYLLYANALIVLTDAHHLAIEAVGIPASAVAYYLLNARFVFHQPVSWHAFRSFVGITIFGWVSFLTVSALSTDVAGLAPQAGHLAGVAVNSAVNLIVQQSVTFKPRGSKETRVGQYDDRHADIRRRKRADVVVVQGATQDRRGHHPPPRVHD